MEPQNVNWLSDEDYRSIFSKVPRVCIDLVVKNYNDEVLLSLRAIQPYMGLWHLPGGMIYKGESFYEACKRIAKKETGLDITTHKIVGQYEILSEVRIDHVQHVIVLLCEVEVESTNLNPDYQSMELRFFKSIPKKTIPMHEDVLKKYIL